MEVLLDAAEEREQNATAGDLWFNHSNINGCPIPNRERATLVGIADRKRKVGSTLLWSSPLLNTFETVTLYHSHSGTQPTKQYVRVKHRK